MCGLQERSFKEFAGRPENKPLLEQHQQQEVAAALQLQEQEQLATLQQQVTHQPLLGLGLLPRLWKGQSAGAPTGCK
jgi:hypothetical protein